MTGLELYEMMLEFKDDPEMFAKKKDEIFEQFINSLPEGKQNAARQFIWQMNGQLRQYKDPIAYMNKNLELIANSLATLQLALDNPDALIARSQDGSKAVVLPLHRKEDS